MKSVRFFCLLFALLCLLSSFPIRAEAPSALRGGAGEGFEWAIAPRFDYAYGFDPNGMAIVGMETPEGWQYGYINAEGEEVIPLRFEQVWSFVYGLAPVCANNKCGYIDERGVEVILLRFASAWYFAENGLARVEATKDKWGFINRQGEMVIPPRFDFAGGFESKGLALVKRNEKFGYINAQGEEVIPLRFDEAAGFEDNGLARVKLNGKWGLINERGEVVTSPRFDRIWSFTRGMAQIGVNDEHGHIKLGYIDKQGEEVIPPRFEQAWDFTEHGWATVLENGKWGYIGKRGEVLGSLWPFAARGKWGYANERGEEVVPPRFDGAGDFASNGLARVMVNGKQGYIDRQGREIVPPRYERTWDFWLRDDIRPNEKGLARVEGKEGQGYINERGKEIVPPRFEDVEAPSANGLALVRVGNKWGYIRVGAQKTEAQ